MTTKIKKGQRVGRNPKTGTEVPNPPRLVIVFTLLQYHPFSELLQPTFSPSSMT